MHLPKHPATWTKLALLVATVVVGLVFHNPIHVENKTVVQKVAMTPEAAKAAGYVKEKGYMPRAVCLGLKEGDDLWALKRKYKYTQDSPWDPYFKIAENHKQQCMVGDDGTEGEKVGLVGLWIT